MKIIVTGGAGFVGTHLVDVLRERGHLVLVVDKKTGHDLTQPQSVAYMLSQMPNPDFIVSLAGTCSTPRGFTEPQEAFFDNTLAMFNVMQFAKSVGAKVIHTSTTKAQRSDDGMYTPYGLTKLMGEMIVREWSDCYGVPTIVNRPGTIYGPGQHGSDESGWLGWFIKAALTNQQVVINGDGKYVRDPLYVRDYVNLILEELEDFDAYLHTLKHASAVSVGGGFKNQVRILEALSFINTLVPLRYTFGPVRKGDNAHLVGMNSILNWKAETSWRDGIEQTIRYYQKHKELL